MKRGKVILLVFLFAILLVELGFYFRTPAVLFSPGGPYTPIDFEVKNLAPFIVSIEDVDPNYDLIAGTTAPVSFNFTARDRNGINDFDDATATAILSKSGESDRTVTCILDSSFGNNKKYQCSVLMEYYDDDGTWSINVSVSDVGGLSGWDDSTATTDINLLKDIDLDQPSIDFGSADPGAENVTLNSVDITNNGNFEDPGDNTGDGLLSITAIDLVGLTLATEVISASSFLAADAAEVATICATGTQLSNDTIINTNVALTRGASGGGSMTFCIPLVPEVSAQSYQASGANQWKITI